MDFYTLFRFIVSLISKQTYKASNDYCHLRRDIGGGYMKKYYKVSDVRLYLVRLLTKKNRVSLSKCFPCIRLA